MIRQKAGNDREKVEVQKDIASSRVHGVVVCEFKVERGGTQVRRGEEKRMEERTLHDRPRRSESEYRCALMGSKVRPKSLRRRS